MWKGSYHSKSGTRNAEAREVKWWIPREKQSWNSHKDLKSFKLILRPKEEVQNVTSHLPVRGLKTRGERMLAKEPRPEMQPWAFPLKRTRQKETRKQENGSGKQWNITHVSNLLSLLWLYDIGFSSEKIQQCIIRYVVASKLQQAQHNQWKPPQLVKKYLLMGSYLFGCDAP